MIKHVALRNIDADGNAIVSIETEVFLPNDPPPIDEEPEEGNEDISEEVGIKLDCAAPEENHCRGYYDHDKCSWWVDLGGASVGYRKMWEDELEYWYHL